MIRRGVLHACLGGSLALCLLLLFVGWQKATDSSSLREALLAHQVLPAAAMTLVPLILAFFAAIPSTGSSRPSR